MVEDPVSTLALQIVQRASQADVAVADLAALAEGDAGFAVRLLAVANAPVNGISRRIVNVRQAASLLGSRGIQNVALGLCVAGIAPLGPVGELLMALSMRRACAAMSIAELCKLPASGDHFATGLLLEIGVLMLARDQVDRVAPLARTPSNGRLVRERALGIEPHPFAGARLARKWHLPADMTQAIEHHHDATPLAAPLARTAWGAERVAAVFEGGDTPSLRSGAIGALGVLGIAANDAETLLKELPDRVLEAASAFGRGVGPTLSMEKVMSDANMRLFELNTQYQELVRMMEGLLAEKETLVESLRVANAQLSDLAASDSLTKLLNRRALFEAADREVARAKRNGLPLSVVLFDVDHFKICNDTYGHHVGDEVLRGVAEAARASLRTGDVLGRYGGEEFALVLAETDANAAAALADRVRTAIAAVEYATETGPFRVTASFGVTSLKGEDAFGALLKRADTALYEAKNAGRNRVVVSS
ncbi:MAG: diguanylate cyclase [Myxococcales bacterium]|nr:diguanylate cyclase [Myxococcales bacterium]